MVETVSDMVERWARESGKSQHLLEIRDLLRLLATELYSQYQPFPESPPFWDRLRAWLENVPDGNDRKQLFEFVPWLLFVGRRELEVMYRAAFSGPITRWIIDEEPGLDITASDFTNRFQEALNETFFGSIAGMDIGSFFRVNELRGQSLRPDFRVLAKLGDPVKTSKYLTSFNIKRIVAVEDYVGTGSQMNQAAQFLSQLSAFSILLCPMIVARGGVAFGEALAKGHIKFAPSFIVPASATLPESAPIDFDEPQELSNLRTIAIRFWQQVQGTDPDPQIYEPLGFKNTGSLVMTYFNCPDNVPPLIHHLSNTWEPLFRRMYREA